MEDQHENRTPLPDPGNVLALTIAVNLLSSLDVPADQRSTRIQQLGQEIEDRAHTLIEQTQRYRGVAEDRPALALVPVAPEPVKPPDLSARLRDALLRYREGFTVDELALELDVTVPVCRKMLKPHELSGVVEQFATVARKPLYRYNKPEPPGGGPSSHPTRVPEWRDNPAYTEARATGLPVRVSAQKRLTRKGRSTAGTGHLARQRDLRYEKMMDARERAANEQRFKYLREHGGAAGINQEKTSPKKKTTRKRK